MGSFLARRPSWRTLIWLLLAGASLLAVLLGPRETLLRGAALRFSVPEGAVLNEFFRQGQHAAHLVLRSGLAPRIVVAFPAGNSGAAIWFETGSALQWQSRVTLQVPTGVRTERTSWNGVTAEFTATGGPLRISHTILGSVRVLRTFDQTGVVPRELLVSARVSGRQIEWRRRRIDDRPGYELTLEVLDGTIARAEGAQGHDRATQPSAPHALELRPAADGRLRLRLTALTAEAPLHPLDERWLLKGSARSDLRLRNILSFLSYEEKLLAGSWRFNTYFGRDTLMTLLLLSPVAQPQLMEAGLGAVLERLSPSGEVAHEEDVGEYALLRRSELGLSASDRPLLDYTMVDDDFMLALVAARYFSAANERVSAFLARRTRQPESVSYGEALVRNLRFVLASARAFAREPVWRNLISLKEGSHAGNWRDSEDGLGGGRYAYDVNGVLAAAALEACARLAQTAALQPYLDSATKRSLADAAAMADIWKRAAPALFEVVIAAPAARSAVEAYARSIGVDPRPALAALSSGPVRLRAVALDQEGQPIPVLNSDEALGLLLLPLDPAEVVRIVKALARPFPAGLMTDVGLLVANPAYAPGLAQRFDRSHYHGTVIWGWQQSVLAAALARQLARTDLPPDARATVQQARDRLRAVNAKANAQRGSELWSWSQAQGIDRIEPFGQRAADQTESNAAQLWSTIQLAP